MTIIMTMIGMVVFTISIFTVGFKPAFKRLGAFILVGFIIDCLFILLALLVGVVAIA